ncbi:oligosaccharide flippase family protein [Colwellia sp. 12G3]|uniref:oligosaccharide flippase family protein n=1 Tax=Colwellia sp. 12G3 TaxID=2058299 RepID=UPI0012FF3446|nr:oligosaccharide flippase family protein [Colwellia sp. 12G3]
MSATHYVFSFLQRIYAAVLLLGTTAFVSRWLTPTEIGIYSLGFAFVAILNAFRNFGIQNYVVVSENLTDKKISSAQLAALILSWPLGICVFTLSSNISELYGQPELIKMLKVQSLAFFLWPFIAIRSGVLQRSLKFNTIFWVETIAVTISSVVMLFCVYLGYGPISLAYGAAILSISSFFLLSIVVKTPWSLSLDHIKECMSFGGMSTLIALITVFGGQGLVMLLGLYFSSDRIAQFERAQSLPLLFWAYILPAISAVLLPSFSKLFRDNELSFARKSAIRSWMSISCVIGPLLISMFFVASDFVDFLYGPQWGEASKVTSLFCLSSLIAALFIIGQSILYAQRKLISILVVQGIALSTTLIGIFIIPELTLSKIAYLFVISNSVFAILTLVFLRRAIRADMRHFKVFIYSLAKYSLPLLLSLICYDYLATSQGFSEILNVFVIAMISIIVWGITSIINQHPMTVLVMKKSAKLARLL